MTEGITIIIITHKLSNPAVQLYHISHVNSNDVAELSR